MANAAKYGVFCSYFAETNFQHFEFDQLLTNSFPLVYLHIYLRIFVLIGNLVVEVHFLQYYPAHHFIYGGVL